jgi:hypothetical protein
MDEWARTSSVLAFLAEPHRDRKKRSKPFKPADFDPFHHMHKSAPTPDVGIRALKAVFIDRKPLNAPRPPRKPRQSKPPRKDTP